MNRDKDQNSEQERDFPGYPHYPAREDITNPQNNNGKAPVNEENISPRDGSDEQEEADDDTKIVMGTEADVTEEDLKLLGDKDADMDMGEDEEMEGMGLDSTDEDGDPLNEESGTMASTGDDLDIPGDEDAQRRNMPGEEDEENDYYSLGSDNNDNITEDTP